MTLIAVAVSGAATLVAPVAFGAEEEAFKFGLTPVFLSNDLELLGHLKTYLASKIGGPVELVTRRTYQEITALLVSGQIQSAWICGYPYVQFKADLDLVATPVMARQAALPVLPDRGGRPSCRRLDWA